MILKASHATSKNPLTSQIVLQAGKITLLVRHSMQCSTKERLKSNTALGFIM
mgnify:CR=1 FL=1